MSSPAHKPLKNPRAAHGFRGRSCSITAVGSYVPSRVLTNLDLEKMVNTTDEWITTRTGIKERRLAATNEYTSDLAAQAARCALERAKVDSKQIAISSDRVPREIPTLEERLRSRFEWGLIADIQPPDLETKAAILRKKAQAQGVRLPDEVSLFIAKHVKSSIRELEGSLVRLAAQASFTHRDISLDLAHEVLKELSAEQQRLPTISTIQKAVAEFYGVRVDDLRSRGRNKSIVLPRQVAMYLCREIVKASLPDIGDGFGGKDHSTVIHACEKVKRKIAGEETFRKQVDELTVRLSP